MAIRVLFLRDFIEPFVSFGFQRDLVEPFVSFENFVFKKNFWIINGNLCSFSARFYRAIRTIRVIRVQSCCSFNIFAILAVL